MEIKPYEVEDIVAVRDALVNTMRAKYPNISANEMYDHLIMAAAVMGADIARHQLNPEKCAEQYGRALTGNVKIFLMEVK